MIAEDLKKIIKGDVEYGNEILDKYSEDYSIFRVKPEAVVFPKDSEDVKNLVKFVSDGKKKGENVSLTGRSAGTDMSGGPLNESVIVEFSKYFNHILRIESDEAVVEPGVYFRDFERELQKKNLLYPAYPASKDLCALGGMVNNNSGGELTLKYGKTENYVEELRMVMSDGEEHILKPLKGEELNKKLSEQSFEGEIYRKLHKLIEDNYETIMKAKPKVSKNSAGYYLWNVWNKETFDITKIIVGSQGTFGLLTSAKLKLIKAPKYSRLIVIFSKNLEPIPEMVDSILPLHPDSIESYDDKTLKLAIKFFPALLALMKGSIFKMLLEFLPEVGMIIKGGMPKMILLVSVSADDPVDLEKQSQAVVLAAKKFPVQIRSVKDETEAKEYWTVRRQSFNLLHSHVKGMDAAPFIDDIIVDPKFMPEFLPQVNAVLDRYKKELIYTIAGHPGNGNFHIIPLVNLKDERVREIIPKVTEEIYKLVFRYGGSITAEHNDGLIRTPYLGEMYGEKIVSLFSEVKEIFDPLHIFNPGKKVGATLEYAARHIKK